MMTDLDPIKKLLSLIKIKPFTSLDIRTVTAWE